MDKSEALKKLEKLLEDAGEKSAQYKKAFESFVNNWGEPGRNINRPGDLTNGKKKGRDRDFFGKDEP